MRKLSILSNGPAARTAALRQWQLPTFGDINADECRLDGCWKAACDRLSHFPIRHTRSLNEMGKDCARVDFRIESSRNRFTFEIHSAAIVFVYAGQFTQRAATAFSRSIKAFPARKRGRHPSRLPRKFSCSEMFGKRDISFSSRGDKSLFDRQRSFIFEWNRLLVRIATPENVTKKHRKSIYVAIRTCLHNPICVNLRANPGLYSKLNKRAHRLASQQTT
jgi:hypothetical protein